MLKKITYIFPSTKKEEKEFFQKLSLLLSELPNIHHEGNEIVITPQQPVKAFPITMFVNGDVSSPQIVLDTPEAIVEEIGGLQIRNTTASLKTKIDAHTTSFKSINRTDAMGEYREIVTNNKSYYVLTIEELYERLHKHVVRIDHTGVNIPATMIDQNCWDTFIQKMAASSNLYHYPTGEPWLFILPATLEEHKSVIENFPIGRDPKFEIVYDTYEKVPTIQIDIESDLTRKEVEEIFPKPYGLSFDGLAEYFRTVYIDHPWAELAIRFDIRFKNDDQDNDWNTGKWLVKDGGRVRAK